MEVHGVASRSNDLDTLSLNGAGENGGRHRAISGHLVRLLRAGVTENKKLRHRTHLWRFWDRHMTA
jgi:hypothetical protein